jgi:peroxiredoxin
MADIQWPQIDFTHVGPAIGTRFPDVTLPDQHGQTIDLHQARGNRRALVVFYRSARWWPYCRTQLVELQKAWPDYERQGIAIFGISYDPRDVLEPFAARHGIQFPLLSDVGSTVIRALGLENRHAVAQHQATGAPIGDNLIGTPYPGTFVLDENGVVVDRRFYISYRERETGAGLLEAAFGLPSSEHGPEVRLDSPQLSGRAYLDSPYYARSQRLNLIVELALARGLHVYGQPIPEGFIPLTVEVEPIEGVRPREAVLPSPRPFRIEGLSEEFFVYEDRVRVVVPIAFEVAEHDQELGVKVSYQTCSETECWPPTTWKFSLTVKVASLTPAV